MSQKTGIEWTEATWNPLAGCSMVSPGCHNCYAMKVAFRMEKIFENADSALPHMAMASAKYKGTTKKVNGKIVWTGKVNIDERGLVGPLKRRRPTKYFVNSMSDLFHEDVPDDFIDRVFAVMALCPQHTFQILTKRAARMRAYCAARAEKWEALCLQRDQAYDDDHTCFKCGGEGLMQLSDCPEEWGEDSFSEVDRLIECPDCAEERERRQIAQWPLPNVWLGVSVESEEYKDRIDELRRTPAAVRFVSAEPLLGALDIAGQLSKATLHHVSMSVSGALRNKAFDGLTDSDGEPLSRKEAQAQLELLQASGVKLVSTGGCEGFSDQTGCPGHPLPGLDWVICGGESGPNARPMHPDWARGLRDQCAAAGVPFFFKQWGEWAPADQVPGHPREHDSHPWSVKVGKKRAGRLLDGVLHDAMPGAVALAK